MKPAKPASQRRPSSASSAPSPSSSIRAVVALKPPAATRKTIVELQEGLKPLLEETRTAWAPSADLHLPLQLFTDISPSALRTFQSSLQQLTQATAPFEITLKGIGITPSWRKPRTLWVGMDKGRDVLRRLSQGIVKAASEASVMRRQEPEVEQRITLATWSDVYVKELNSSEYRDSCILHGNRFLCTWQVKEVVVLKSTLAFDGEQLEPLFSVSLAAAKKSAKK